MTISPLAANKLRLAPSVASAAAGASQSVDPRADSAATPTEPNAAGAAALTRAPAGNACRSSRSSKKPSVDVIPLLHAAVAARSARSHNTGGSSSTPSASCTLHAIADLSSAKSSSPESGSPSSRRPLQPSGSSLSLLLLCIPAFVLLSDRNSAISSESAIFTS